MEIKTSEVKKLLEECGYDLWILKSFTKVIIGLYNHMIFFIGIPQVSAFNGFQSQYWLNYWHIPISKGTSGFTSNTLLIRIQYCIMCWKIYWNVNISLCYYNILFKAFLSTYTVLLTILFQNFWSTETQWNFWMYFLHEHWCPYRQTLAFSIALNRTNCLHFCFPLFND